MTVIQALIKTLRAAAVFNPQVQVAPACILWPDKDRQWEAVIPRLQSELGELLVLGDFAPERRTGPAIWLRCVLANTVADIGVQGAGDRAQGAELPPDTCPLKPNTCTIGENRVQGAGCRGQGAELPPDTCPLPPILYLPGVSRQDLRAVESCPDHLKPLAELQYRGVIWSQVNAKDWTIMAFLKSDQGGLGLDVAQDNEAKHAMQLALYRLLDESLQLLKGKRLDKDYFNTLLTGGDPVRDLLQWLDLGDSFQASRGASEWQAFVAVCQSQLAFNPQADGVLAGAGRLATREGPWQAVWERYSEAPKRYPHIPGRIRQCQPPIFDLFATAESAGGWPQWNEDQEQALRNALRALGKLPAHDARKQVLGLEQGHADRRDLVWAEVGESPLAMALKPLCLVAELTQSGLAAGAVEDLQTGYLNQGWRADDGVLAALAWVESPADLEAVSGAIRAIYLPWLEESARYLQKLVDGSTYPGGTIANAKPFAAKDGECVLFVDGLRLDTARRLAARLEVRGCEIQEALAWAALPSVTATGKAAVSPVRGALSGADDCDDFEPSVAATGQSLKGGYHLKKLLTDSQWTLLERSENGDGKGRAWSEIGDIDSEGHLRGWKLAKHLDSLLAEVAERITGLLAAGWVSVRVVTDHGWLLMPGRLPTIPLSKDLTGNQWGRCASIKPGAATSERLYPWYWNPHRQFALADGVSCYGKSVDYTHGGLSLQECLTLELMVTTGGGAAGPGVVVLTEVRWKGLRCAVRVDGQPTNLSLDIRLQAGDAASSVVAKVRTLKDDGTASVAVEDEDLEGRAAFIVVLGATGESLLEAKTVIGGG